LSLTVRGQERKELAEPEKPTNTQLSQVIREVINRGADLYNSGDHAACYRFFEGSILALRPFLAHLPNSQKALTSALSAAEKDPVVWRRAFTLRNALDRLRADLNPTAKDKEKEKDKDKDRESFPPSGDKPDPAPPKKDDKTPKDKGASGDPTNPEKKDDKTPKDPAVPEKKDAKPDPAKSINPDNP
ncbi:MAG: hypothetical protein ACKO23_12735, partial [Gemmataceae bacterium]